ESVVLTGDENLLDVTLTLHYVVADPAAYLFHLSDPETVLRVMTESVLRELAGQRAVDDLLTTCRAQFEQQAARSIQQHLDLLSAGIQVRSVCLQDVHPPMEVVAAYRDVASAMEEKGKAVNQAEAYRLQEVPLARGEAVRSLREAEGYTLDRANRSAGDAEKFVQTASARRAGPQVTDIRLYLETVEQVLSGPRKFIVDRRANGRRQLLLLDGKDGLVNLDALSPAAFAPAQPEIPPEH
ncbi:MAG: FtsH protease activity modulator HflK, partial [Armatimonadota bacterium]|nr:FtsH protease activity modulator HflK [Armatimonadota bacterium]